LASVDYAGRPAGTALTSFRDSKGIIHLAYEFLIYSRWSDPVMALGAQCILAAYANNTRQAREMAQEHTVFEVFENGGLDIPNVADLRFPVNPLILFLPWLSEFEITGVWEQSRAKGDNVDEANEREIVQSSLGKLARDLFEHVGEDAALLEAFSERWFPPIIGKAIKNLQTLGRIQDDQIAMKEVRQAVRNWFAYHTLNLPVISESGNKASEDIEIRRLIRRGITHQELFDTLRSSRVIFIVSEYVDMKQVLPLIRNNISNHTLLVTDTSHFFHHLKKGALFSTMHVPAGLPERVAAIRAVFAGARDAALDFDPNIDLSDRERALYGILEASRKTPRKQEPWADTLRYVRELNRRNAGIDYFPGFADFWRAAIDRRKGRQHYEDCVRAYVRALTKYAEERQIQQIIVLAKTEYSTTPSDYPFVSRSDKDFLEEELRTIFGKKEVSTVFNYVHELGLSLQSLDGALSGSGIKSFALARPMPEKIKMLPISTGPGEVYLFGHFDNLMVTVRRDQDDGQDEEKPSPVAPEFKDAPRSPVLEPAGGRSGFTETAVIAALVGIFSLAAAAVAFYRNGCDAGHEPFLWRAPGRERRRNQRQPDPGFARHSSCIAGLFAFEKFSRSWRVSEYIYTIQNTTNLYPPRKRHFEPGTA
jgi:hypothetical protein